MKHFRPLRTQSSPSRRGHGGEPVEVGAGLRLGDREDDLVAAVGDAGQEALPLLLGAVLAMIVPAIAGETTSSSSGQPAAASSSHDDGQLGDAAARRRRTRSGRLTPEVAELAGLGPQLVGVPAGLAPCPRSTRGRSAAPSGRPRRAAAACSGVWSKFMRAPASPRRATTASTAPGLDLAPGGDLQLGHDRRPPARARVCSIFIASRVSSRSPARHPVCPRTTAPGRPAPGIGASSEPGGRCGDRRRGSGAARSAPPTQPGLST